MVSFIESFNGNPTLNIDGRFHYPVAYTTYFDECGSWKEFIGNGYKMFFVNISFTDLPINNFTGFTPFLKGVFETEKTDYGDFEATVNKIISECPDAMIFPRINLAMPRRWIQSHPDETVSTPHGNRESMYSESFRKDGAELLGEMISHFRNSAYAHNIAGYQLCGGITQEWMHHDMFGSYSDYGMRKFTEWVKNKYGTDEIKIPERKDFLSGKLTNEIRKYYEFCNEANVETVEFFAEELKKMIKGEQIVGVFYGYNAFVNDPLLGLHGMRNLIDSPFIDFFSSPCAYDGNRNLGIDWGDMLAVDSIRLHGKLCFIECDIRTHLTRAMQESRPGVYPEGIYTLTDDKGNKTVWSGPETRDMSLSAIRKAFAHQLSKSSGIWWFDMWGGWYKDDILLNELKTLRIFAEESLDKCNNKSEVALFIDESGYFNNPFSSPLRNAVNEIRVAMGNTGIPFDIFMTEDAEKVIGKYKAVIFTSPLPSENGRNAIDLYKSLGIPYLASVPDKQNISVDEIREFLISQGVHCFNSDGCVIYNSAVLLGVHSIKNGEIIITLPVKRRLRSLDDNEIYDADSIVINAKKYHTYLFEYKN